MKKHEIERNIRGHDYTGEIIGALKVVKRLPSINGPLWLAVCHCKEEIEISSRALRRQAVPSCGCKRALSGSRIHKDPKRASFHNYLSRYKYRCKRDKIVWDLTDDQFEKLIFSHCYYCNIKPSHIVNVYSKNQFKDVRSAEAKKRHEEAVIFVNGIDRLDSNKNYTHDNCVPCCQDCNYGKYTQSLSSFLSWIDRVYEYQHLNPKPSN